jgi:hypothetical protein
MIRNFRGSTLTRSRWAGIGAAVAVSLGAGGIGFIAHAANSAPSSFVSITPCRLFDTRPAPANVGNRNTPLNAGEDFFRQVTGANGDCTIPAGATAISYNLTVPNGLDGFLTLYPADGSLPNASTINPVTGQGVKVNGGIVGLSATGAIKLYTLRGPLDALLDVTGYFVPGIAGPAGPTGPAGPVGATGMSTGHIDGATGAPAANFAKAGTWTSTKTGPGQYQITVPGLIPGCVITKPLPNPVVTVWYTGAVATTPSAYINGVGSSCVSGDWYFYVQTTLDDVAANSDFTFEFVTPA